MNMKRLNIVLFITSVLFSVTFFSCGGDPLEPGHEYMPDMYRSKSYETYSDNDVFANKMEAQLPVAGTVPRDYDLYPYQNTPDGYEKAGSDLKNPFQYSETVVTEGKVLYDKFCVHCHGDAGKGDGKVATNPKYPGPPPAYDSPQLINLSDGKMFHSITYGKGNMGSHSSQLTKEERWKLVHYINKLQGDNIVVSEKTDTTVVKN